MLSLEEVKRMGLKHLVYRGNEREPDEAVYEYQDRHKKWHLIQYGKELTESCGAKWVRWLADDVFALRLDKRIALYEYGLELTEGMNPTDLVWLGTGRFRVRDEDGWSVYQKKGECRHGKMG